MSSKAKSSRETVPLTSPLPLASADTQPVLEDNMWVTIFWCRLAFSPWSLALAFSLTPGLKDQAILSLGLWSAACIRYFSNILVWIWIFFRSFGSGILLRSGSYPSLIQTQMFSEPKSKINLGKNYFFTHNCLYFLLDLWEGLPRRSLLR